MTAIRLFKTAFCLALIAGLSLASPALATFGLEWDYPDQGAVGELTILQSFHTSFTNTGNESDTYTVSIVKSIPETWLGTICVGETCYPPFITEVEVDLAAGETEFLDIDITALDLGSGSILATVASQGNPALRMDANFTLISAGLDLLVVTDDSTPSLESYVTDLLAGGDRSFGVWKQVEMGALSYLELETFGSVIWNAGNLTGALDEEDRAALANFVQHGGNLFLSGRDLAYEGCDPGSPYYSANSLSWFQTVLGTDYTGDVASNYAQARGVPGDLVAGDLDFNLFGGDGADNTASTLDGLTAFNGGTASLVYYDQADGEDAAIRSSYGDGKTYFCGFAFEAIADAASRQALLTTALDWFDGLLVVPVNDELNQPLLTRAPYAAPNPFNPQTSIKFAVGGSEELPAEIDVFDLKGRLVRRLFKGTVAPGPQDFVWNGRNDQGQNLATGVYLAQVKLAGATTQTVKMTLAK